jgi:hypothetical protein
MFIASMELSQKSKLDQGESGGSTDKDVLSSTWEESDKACKRETGIKERRRKGKG